MWLGCIELNGLCVLSGARVLLRGLRVIQVIQIS